MDVVVVADVPVKQQADSFAALRVRPGGMLHQHLLTGSPERGPNFRFFRSTYLSGENSFTSPRHHHGFQQLRWAESGSVNYGPDQNIEAGDIAYFPRGTFYGPQIKDGGVGWVLQYGFHGELQSGPDWDGHRKKAMDDLESRGRFNEGVYHDVDLATGEDRQRDAAQAIYEATCELATGKKFVVPAEGYETPILMHTAAFDYYEVAPGVEMKQLGRFFDHAGPNADIHISMLRLTGGRHTLGPERGQIAWAQAAGMQIDGKIYPELTCLYCPRDEMVELSSEGDVEVYVVEFPRLD